MRYILPLACSESRSQLHIAQTVPLQTVFSTAYSGILCSWSAPQAPPEAPSTGRKPGISVKTPTVAFRYIRYDLYDRYVR